MSNDTCNATTANGTPCANSACRSDGRCWIHTQTDESADIGRDSKLTKQRQEAIAAMIENGHSVTAAARNNGVTKQTVMNWLGKGENQDSGIYADFFDRYTRARGEGERQYLELIREMAKEDGDHRFLASLMKQRYPDSWGETDTGVDATNIEITVDDAIDDLHEQWQ